jgi:hypothetical protein
MERVTRRHRGNRRIEGGDRWEVAGVVGHPVLGRKADRRGGHGQEPD